MSRLTEHAKKRVKQRIKNNRNSNELLTRALRKGKVKERYIGEFYDYLAKKSEQGAKIKVYKDNIYVISKNSKRLVTVYGVPAKYKPIKQYEIDTNKTMVLYYPYKYKNKDIIIVVSDGTEIKGNLTKIKFCEEKAITYILKLYNTDEYLEISTDEIIKIDLDFENINLELFGEIV